MIGKVNDNLFTRFILPCTGAPSRHVVLGPQMGVDAAVLRSGDEYMVIAEDPIFPGPSMTPEDYGWITVHIGASDVAVMGVRPEFMTYSLLLPPGTPDDYVARLVRAISDSASELGISIVGGHTGFYGAVTVPTIGGISVWGRGERVITPTGAQVGDAVVITKGAAIEAAALLACELSERLIAAGTPPELVQRARSRLREITVVKDAAVATAAGGVHAMHDATEGGLARGLWEVAQASGVGLRIKRSAVPVPADVHAVCAHFGLNPLEVISEGTLVLACAPGNVAGLLSAFRNAGIEAAEIGVVLDQTAGRMWVAEDGSTEPIVPPAVDRFWDVFFGALALTSDARSAEHRQLCSELQGAVARLEAADVASLIPEIGANMAYAASDARTLADVAAIPGRLLRLGGKVTHLGEPEMGCSRYMAGSLLMVRDYFPEARCIINLRSNERIRSTCEALGLRVASMPEVQGYRQSDAEYERDLRQTLKCCREMPQVVSIPDRINLERLILVLGRTLDEVVATVKAIATEI